MSKGKRKKCVIRVIAFLSALSFYPFPFTPCPFPPTTHAAHLDSAPVSTVTREGRLAVFDDAWARINERYYDQSFHGLDWDAQRTIFRDLAANAASSEQLYAVLRRMIASLNDPHTRVFAPDEKFDWWRPRYVTVGFTIAEVNGSPTVTRVDRSSAPQRAGMRAGDVIETVDGEAALSLIRGRLANISEPASGSVRFRVFAKLLDGPADSSVEITWKGKDGKPKSGRFARYWQERELSMRVFRERGAYPVVEIEAFTKPIAIAFARSLRQQLAGARGLILDLRTNGGGDAEAMSDVASSFLGFGANLGQFTDRAGSSFTIYTHAKSMLSTDTLAQTSLPIIVLTSERTASAAEIFIEALRSSRRATIIGTETCGCVLAVRTRHVLPDGGLLDVSELDYQTAEGQRLEGHGLKPDETVTIERHDLYAGRDRALESALTELSRLRIAMRQG